MIIGDLLSFGAKYPENPGRWGKEDHFKLAKAYSNSADEKIKSTENEFKSGNKEIKLADEKIKLADEKIKLMDVEIKRAEGKKY